ncbi:hypothetical protein ET445_12285 [Agromyces protaetiae]|uniref:Acetone carboxylase n=1 Tax=Agromyces protaetiae TaxID=2509455 RepID=A0A4V0YHA2_9MICO|nr:hypothetical protein [Agromyces protaetiae]QAY74001.1 hypothetical protein ET445_12285 [Agromyces protaetiae]
MIGLPGAAPAADVCSRAGCREAAAWRVDWRNPKIHDETRTKTWLACDEHVDYLRGFLESRSFPVRVARFDETGAEASGANA